MTTTQIDILYNRIESMYIKIPDNISDIKLYAKQQIEKSLNYQAITLYDHFYLNTFIYKLTIHDNYIIANLLREYKNKLDDDMIIVNKK